MSSNSTHKSNFSAGVSNEKFLQRLGEKVEANFQNEQFGVEELARQMNMSRSQLHRKLKQVSNKSANQFIREYRLKRAKDLLCNENKPISEVAFEVGFGSISYFTTCFTAFFHQSPGNLRRKSILRSSQKPTGRRKLFKHLQGKPIIIVIVINLIYISALSGIFLHRISNANFNNYKSISTLESHSIAVLPFKNLNKQHEYEYFSRGIVEAVNRHLSKLDALKVVSLTAVDFYRENTKSIREIGNELLVANVLEGSFQHFGNMIRLEVRLIDTSSESLIWAEYYDRELEDIFKTQTEIAEQVALALNKILSPEEKKLINVQITENIDAYDLYLKGLYENRIYTRKANHHATEFFKKAIELDSTFALAYAGLAQSIMAKAAIFGAEMSALEALALSKPYIDISLALDPNLEEGHVWNGFYLLYNNWDFKGAEQEYSNAITGNNPDALAVYADYLNFIRSHDKALEISVRLNQEHPFYPNSRMILSLYYLGRIEEAEKFAQARSRLFNNYYTLDNYGFLKLNTGNYPEAIRIFGKLLERDGVRYPRILGWMGAAYACLGQIHEADNLIAELESIANQTHAGSPAFFIAVIHSALGDKISALHWLQQAIKAHEMEIPWLLSEPQFFSLHDEPDFQKMLVKVGFPDPD